MQEEQADCKQHEYQASVDRHIRHTLHISLPHRFLLCISAFRHRVVGFVLLVGLPEGFHICVRLLLVFFRHLGQY